MKKVIYLFGYGRSGTTLLSLLATSHNDIVSTGELINLASRGWVGDTRCSCKQRANSCPFWSQVREKWSKKSEIKKTDEFIFLIRKIKTYFSVSGGIKKRLSDIEYAQLLQSVNIMYKSIFEISGKNVLLDASKVPLWGLFINELPDIEVYPVFMYRDGRGVVNSLEKSGASNKKKRFFNSKKINIAFNSFKWAFSNYCVEKTILKLNKPVMRISYEELSDNPLMTIKKIADFAGMDKVQFNKEKVYVNRAGTHVLAGNKMRTSENIHITRDIDWTRNLDFFDEIIYWLTSAFYGYTLGYKPFDRK